MGNFVHAGSPEEAFAVDFAMVGRFESVIPLAVLAVLDSVALRRSVGYPLKLD